jgi:hypothetical protein
VTDQADYTAQEASQLLGIEPPDKVIPIIAGAGYFRFGGVVAASNRYVGGGLQWFANQTIPGGNVLPAIPIASAP